MFIVFDNTPIDMTTAIIVLIAIDIYFLPLIIACLRRHKHTAYIGVLNLFLGWTVMLWVVALGWSVSDSPGA